jgi:hypothetical protein
MGRRKFLEVAEKCYGLPGLRVVERFAPCRHARPANAMNDNIVILVFRHVGRFFEKAGYGRIEGSGKLTVGIGWDAVTSAAMIQIQGRTRDKVLFRGRRGILRAGSATVS